MWGGRGNKPFPFHLSPLLPRNLRPSRQPETSSALGITFIPNIRASIAHPRRKGAGTTEVSWGGWICGPNHRKSPNNPGSRGGETDSKAVRPGPGCSGRAPPGTPSPVRLYPGHRRAAATPRPTARPCPLRLTRDPRPHPLLPQGDPKSLLAAAAGDNRKAGSPQHAVTVSTAAASGPQ